ncbi:hypothetical protein [uncultured Maribacter sp.]|uniref:glucosamine inositolphosphorylceramide transferase family protein n=1 Tax=uncultured Maribacter sp. TaxID=431308 RepID=UPI0026396D04|nr:hypothetical protein [uncultured Maribacter sp.]
MKIGLLINNLRHIPSWKLRVMEFVINNPKLELILVISTYKKNNTNFILKLLIAIQTKIERLLFFKKPFFKNKLKIEKELNSLTTINFKKNITNKELSFLNNLDLIINLNKLPIEIKLKKFPQYGIWNLKFGKGNEIFNNAIGAWDVINKSKNIKVDIIKSNINGSKIINSAWFNRHWSIVKTNDNITESSVALLIKNINNIEQNATILDSCFSKKNNDIHFVKLIIYIMKFYLIIAYKFLSRIKWFFFKKRQYCFTLAVGKGNALTYNQLSEKSILPDDNEYWADPFLFPYKNKTYVFFENFSYKSKIGKISCGVLENNCILHKEDALVLNTHLSYPYIFKEKNNIFLMPENSEKGGLHIYKCITFPNKWTLYSSCFIGEKIVDASFYTDNENQKWLFLNKGDNENVPMENELYIFKIDSLKFNTIIPHKQNPVLIDSRIARNAGSVFNYKENAYRPSQANIDGVYGKNININKIEILNIEVYKEKTVKVFKPNTKKGFIAMHHIHQIKNQFIYDSALNSL